MKKLLRNGSFIMLLLSLSVGLSACGNKEASAPASTTQAATEKAEETTTEAEETEETTTEEGTTTEVIEETTTEAVEEVEYNPLTTFVYGDTRLDFLTMTMEQWVKLMQQMKIVVERDDVDMSIKLAPYEEFGWYSPPFQYNCYNPTGEEIYLKDAKFLFLEIRTYENENIGELGIFDGKAKLGNTYKEIRPIREELFNGSHSSDYDFVLDNGRELHIRMIPIDKPEKTEEGYAIIDGEKPLEYIRFEITPYYE